MPYEVITYNNFSHFAQIIITFCSFFQVEIRLGEAAPQMLSAVSQKDVEDLAVFVTPFDLDGSREKKTQISPAKYMELSNHLSPDGSDSPMISKLKVAGAKELTILKAVVNIDLCKEIVTYLKRSKLVKLFEVATPKQEVQTRWNSHIEMLRSLSCQWEDVSAHNFYLFLI